MSKNNRLDATQNRQKQIEAQEQIIERRRIQLEQTAKARELLDKLKSQAYQRYVVVRTYPANKFCKHKGLKITSFEEKKNGDYNPKKSFSRPSWLYNDF